MSQPTPLVLLDGDGDLDRFTEIPLHSRISRAEAMQVWEKARSDLYYPPIADPLIVFIETDPEPFGISSENWTTKLNLSFIPPHDILPDDRVLVWFEYSIVKHEINHYLHFPYDRTRSLKCINAIYAVLKDLKGAEVYTKTVLYPFLADIIVDTNLLRLYGDVITWATRVWFQYNMRMNSSNYSVLGLARVRAFEKHWSADLGAPKGVSPEAEDYSDQLAMALGSYVDYPDLARQFAEILRPLLLKEMPIVPSTGGSSEAEDQDSPSSGAPKRYVIPIDGRRGIQVPADFLHQIKESPAKVKSRSYVGMGDSENAIATEDRDLLAMIPTMVDNDADFGRVLRILDFEIPKGDERRLWLRARAYGAIRYEPKTFRPIGEMKHYPMDWSPDYPIERLDLIKSYQNFPVCPVVPPFAKMWKRTAGSYGNFDFGVRDVVILIDSSGSMWYTPKAKKEASRGPYYFAQVGALAILLAARDKGARSVIINFSSKLIATPQWLTADNPNDLRRAEDVIMYHQKGSTLVPGPYLVERVEENPNRCYIPIFSDSDIWNIEENIPYMRRLKERGHVFALFLMGRPKDYRKQSKRLQQLLEVCDTFHVIENYANLLGLVIDDVRNFY